MAEGKPRLTYFAGRGLAEPIRLALSAAGIQYEDVYLESRDQFLQLKQDGKLMFKQVPLLEVDGQCLIGGEAILRYACREGNFEGKTNEDKTRVDMLSMGAKDMVFPNLMSPTFIELMTSKEAADEAREKGVKESRERYLPVFEKLLDESTSGFLVGDSMTMADITFFDALCYLHEDPKLKPELENFPRCSAFIDHFSQQPGIKEYLASPRRNPLPYPEYAQHCCEVLNLTGN
ncbi:glutathione S-transferase alpha-4-like [Lytechinus variegatus]|uniref:glutathione S-transferase alpha-4-like n=1 Tax=Lytechinus variegatus TaxID=7654 RepID=UPI001BB2C5EB|nr:glutathione S-transferase alpha-4-like [Lytechinus variegatus]